MSKEQGTILIVDDEPHVISALKRELDEEAYRIEGAGGGKEALALMARRDFKVVISDEKMPGMDGARSALEKHHLEQEIAAIIAACNGGR